MFKYIFLFFTLIFTLVVDCAAEKKKAPAEKKKVEKKKNILMDPMVPKQEKSIVEQERLEKERLEKEKAEEEGEGDEDYTDESEKNVRKKGRPIKLKLIMIGYNDEEEYCIINGRLLTVGGVIANYIVTDISDEEVTLINNENEIIKLTVY